MSVDGKDSSGPGGKPPEAGGRLAPEALGRIAPEALGRIAPEDRDAFRKRTDDLGRQLDEVSARKVVAPGSSVAGGKGYSMAFRFMVDLLAGIGVGVGIGWVLDRWLNTAPLFLIVFMLLGFAAGMRSVIRAANKEQAKHPVPKDAVRVEDENEK